MSSRSMSSRSMSGGMSRGGMTTSRGMAMSRGNPSGISRGRMSTIRGMSTTRGMPTNRRMSTGMMTRNGKTTSRGAMGNSAGRGSPYSLPATHGMPWGGTSTTRKMVGGMSRGGPSTTRGMMNSSSRGGMNSSQGMVDSIRRSGSSLKMSLPEKVNRGKLSHGNYRPGSNSKTVTGWKGMNPLSSSGLSHVVGLGISDGKRIQKYSGKGEHVSRRHAHGDVYGRPGANHGGKYNGRYARYNHVHLGPTGFGYTYYRNGVGISIGLPLNRYYASYRYFDHYNFLQPSVAESTLATHYGRYVLPAEPSANVPTQPIEVLGSRSVAPGPANPPTSVVIEGAGNATEFQAQAEQAFRENRLADAARYSNHAIVEDSENGKLHLFASQVLFAMGDYRSSAAAVQRGASLLDRREWGYVVENFKDFYRGDDYVIQMKNLAQFIGENPDLSYGHFLQGYHYKYLGYDKAAQTPLARALELESHDRLAADLFIMAGGTLPEEVAPELPAPAGSQPETELKPTDGIPSGAPADQQETGDEGSDRTDSDESPLSRDTDAIDQTNEIGAFS